MTVLWKGDFSGGSDEDWRICSFGGQFAYEDETWKIGETRPTPPCSWSEVSVVDVGGVKYMKSDIIDPDYPSDPSSNIKCRAEAKRWGRLDCAGKWVEQAYDVWYGVIIRLAADFEVTAGSGSWANGCSLSQVHEGPSIGWAGGLRFNIPTQTFKFFIRHYDYVAEEWVSEKYFDGGTSNDTGVLIRGEEFTYILHINSVENGKVEMLLNGETLVDDDGDYRVGPDAVAQGRVSRDFVCGLYCGYEQNAKYALYRNPIVATTLQDVFDYLEEAEEPPPVPTPRNLLLSRTS